MHPNTQMRDALPGAVGTASASEVGTSSIQSHDFDSGCLARTGNSEGHLSRRWSETRRANNKRIDAIFARLKRERGLI